MSGEMTPLCGPCHSPVVCRYYTVAKHLLMAGGDAMERLMTAYKEVVELAGYTQRVATMFRVFDECAQSR